MIKIKKSLTADTRSATEKVSRETLLKSSKQHIGDVQLAIEWMRDRLLQRALHHDWTKIDFIGEFYEDFTKVQNDKSIDFRSLPWFKRHIETERHHVTDRCPDNVNLFDLLERIADITMAGMGRTGSVYPDNLYPEILKRAYQNTLELLKKQIVVED